MLAARGRKRSWALGSALYLLGTNSLGDGQGLRAKQARSMHARGSDVGACTRARAAVRTLWLLGTSAKAASPSGPSWQQLLPQVFWMARNATQISTR